MHLDYLFLRISRRILPPGIMHFLLDIRLFVRPGPETRQPVKALKDYIESLEVYVSGKTGATAHPGGNPIQGKRIMIFGYGGNFALGCMLLRNGAAHVILCDKYASPNHQTNQGLLAEYGEFLSREGEQVVPCPEKITLLQTDIRDTAREHAIQPVDLILSRSVFEHLDDLNGITQALVELTQPDGIQVHFINLGDHYFKYPFEMLTFSEATWSRWLNPTSNLNRWRYPAYKELFERFFGQVEIEVRERDDHSFERTKPRIRPEFLTGDPAIDAITKLKVTVARPKFSAQSNKTQANHKPSGDPLQ
jgi:hypothetical protein